VNGRGRYHVAATKSDVIADARGRAATIRRMTRVPHVHTAVSGMRRRVGSTLTDLHRRVFVAMGFMLLVIVWGSLGYEWIGDGRWSFLDCVYMTVISVTTVGFCELPGMDSMPSARAFTIAVVLVGFASAGFAISTVTALIVEGDLARLRRKKKMKRTIDDLSGHVIVCGVGSTGRHVVEELVSTGTKFVVVDHDEEKLRELAKSHPGVPMPHIHGDATADAVLREAGIERASGLVAALREDKDNLFVVITARAANAGARIVARSGDLRVFELMRKAGANAVVSPNFIGGMRLASELLRPNVVEFLDEMIRDRDMNLRIEEVAIPIGSAFAGKTLRESRIRDVTDALVLAIRDRDRAFRYNPGPDAVLDAGVTLVLLGRTSSVAKFRAAVGSGFKS
jgi:voltage-gated potassium channel